jgi:hypothetical protein
VGKADEAKAITEKKRSGIEVGKADEAKAVTERLRSGYKLQNL